MTYAEESLLWMEFCPVRPVSVRDPFTRHSHHLVGHMLFSAYTVLSLLILWYSELPL